ncbi:MAG TPA: hypothetical protein VKT80_07045, partial [Chloroflexota bacterium]|nr:hypothetical protein [Chloroflexota bacterium]
MGSRPGGRIARQAEVPPHIESELDRNFPYSLPLDLGDCQVRYRRGRWMSLYDDPRDEAPARVRETFAWIERRGERIGAVGFREIDVPDLYNPDEFVIAMDNEDADLGAIADVLRSAWPDLQMMPFGPVLELSYAWVRPCAEGRGVWAPVAQEFLKRLMRRCSLVVSFAVPLEYSSPRDGAEADETRQAHDRRQAAMIRLAHSKL